YFIRLRSATRNELDLSRESRDPSTFDRFPVARTFQEKLVDRIRKLQLIGDEELLSTIRDSFDVEALDLTTVDPTDHFVFTKINHGYWEHVCQNAFNKIGVSYFRKISIDAHSRYYKSGFDYLLARTLLCVVEGPHPNFGAYITNPSKLRFGISFTAGDRTIEQDLKLPLGPLRRAAMIGSHSFLSTALDKEHFTIVDGAAAKKIVYDGKLEIFAEKIKSNSDTVVFIVPPHLRSIELRNWQGKTLRILVPAKYIHELWTIVLPYLASVISGLIATGLRITILSQAAVMSVPIGFLVKQLNEMLPEHAQRRVQYYDLGQVLDLAIASDQVSAPWIKKKQDIRLGSPFYICEHGSANKTCD
ncbi:MAG: hypothetical protein ACRERS_07545, partial [Methylococcales bacterium]